MRWDYLNPYGFQEPDFTPAVNRLAANGVVFGNAVATAGTTIPSHGSMLTGMYPRVHGARSNYHHRYPQVPTVTGALERAGYATGAFVSAGFLLQRGLEDGFDATNGSSWKDEHDEAALNGLRTVRDAVAWLQSVDQGTPAFLWLHLWEPHGPYKASAWSEAQLADYDGPLKDGVSIDQTRTLKREILDDPGNLNALRTHYAGEVNRADRHIGALLDYFERAGKLSNTIFVFTADHGQGLGNGGLLGHGTTHIESVIRVPLIITDFRRPEPARVATRVGTIDIAPTIAEAAGLDDLFEHGGRSLLVPDLLEDDWPYFAEVALRTPKHKRWDEISSRGNYDPNAVAVYVGPYKMTYKQERYRLFRTREDWDEARVVRRGQEEETRRRLAGLIETFHETALDFSTDELSDEEIETLRSLGYTQ